MSLFNEMNYFYYKMSLYELQMMRGKDYYNGISYNSLLYLNVIYQLKDCTASAIAQALHITKSAVTLKINELVKQGAVVRNQSEEDKRIYYLSLSSDMERIMSHYDEVFIKIEKDMKLKYTEKQLEQFEEILHTISGYEWRKKENE